MAASELSALASSKEPAFYDEDFEEPEYEELDDPETLWGTYLRGVRLHGDSESVKNKSNKCKRLGISKDKHSEAIESLPINGTFTVHAKTPEEIVEQLPEIQVPPKEQEAEKPEEKEEETRMTEPTQVLYNKCENKKLRMRPVTEVISRIQWDPDLPAENFSVGYLDRFVGLMEKPFQFFSWEDLASVDYNVLAIPKHRIVYVKYHDHKVWDKNERLDLVFGSTERSKSEDIRDLVQRLDAEHERKAAAYANREFDDDSDDESDDVQVDIDQSATSRNVDRFPECRPNHFVAIRVTDPGVAAKVAEAKRHILSREPRLFDFLMPDGALHITLAMLKLDSPQEISKAANAVKSCRHKLANFLTDPIEVELTGLATFNGYVLYSPVRAPPAFYEFQNSLSELLRDSGVRLAHEYDFVPHMTLLKLTRSRARVFQSPYVDPYVYIDYKDCHFGVQKCDNLQLCIIGEEKRWDGFYNCAAEVYFT